MIRMLTCAFCAVLGGALLAPTAAKADYAVVTIAVNQLPANITLCRDSVSGAQGIDEEFELLIDVDNNASTGVTAHGADAALVIATTPVVEPCGPTTVPLAGNLVPGVFKANAANDNFDFTTVPATVSFDAVNSTVTIAAQIAGPLTGLSSNSNVYLTSAATYASASNSPQIAYDNAPPFKFGSGASDIANDVQQCLAPCSSALSYIQFIDIYQVDSVRTDWVFVSGFDQ